MNLSELIELLKRASSTKDIDKYREEIIDLIPTLKIMVGFDQKNHAHQYDLWMHSLHVVANLPKNLEDDMLYFMILENRIVNVNQQNQMIQVCIITDILKEVWKS